MALQVHQKLADGKDYSSARQHCPAGSLRDPQRGGRRGSALWPSHPVVPARVRSHLGLLLSVLSIRISHKPTSINASHRHARPLPSPHVPVRTPAHPPPARLHICIHACPPSCVPARAYRTRAHAYMYVNYSLMQGTCRVIWHMLGIKLKQIVGVGWV